MKILDDFEIIAISKEKKSVAGEPYQTDNKKLDALIEYHYDTKVRYERGEFYLTNGNWTVEKVFSFKEMESFLNECLPKDYIAEFAGVMRNSINFKLKHYISKSVFSKYKLEIVNALEYRLGFWIERIAETFKI